MKIINKFASRSERERERESNLRTSSSLKKSFTLIELSIVLLILSLLVGSLLVGRQIVDRAKIQRIIFEIDYYEKAFHQFYDTYRYVPGTLPYKECIKHAEFRMPDFTFNGEGGNNDFCSCLSIKKVSNAKLLSSFNSILMDIKPQLAASGLIDAKFSEVFKLYNGLYWGGSNIYQCNNAKRDTSLTTVYSDSKPHPYSFQSSYSARTLIQFHAYNKPFIDANNLWSAFRKHSFNGSNTYITEKYAVEWDNAGFRNATLNHNLMAFVDAPTVFLNGGIRNADDTKKYGALSSKMSSELDAKIDDGRPGSGRVLAMKSAMAHVSATNDKSYIENCYDKDATEIDKAIYHSSTDLKYGCNIIKVMEDVK